MINPFTHALKCAAATYSKSTSQLTFRPSDAKGFIEAAGEIPDKELYTGDDAEKYGRETEPHITVIYGLDEHNPAAVSDLVAHRRPIRVKLGKISRFENERFDVLKVEVKSGPLHNLHQTLRENLPNDYSFPEYNPHVTLAYVKPGAMPEMDGDDRFDGKEFTFDRLTLSSNLGNRALIPFTGLRSVPIDRFKKAASKVIVDMEGNFVFDNPQMKNRFRKVANPYQPTFGMPSFSTMPDQPKDLSVMEGVAPKIPENPWMPRLEAADDGSLDLNQPAAGTGIPDFLRDINQPAAGTGIPDFLRDINQPNTPWYQDLPWGTIGAGGLAGGGLGGLIGGRKGALLGALLGAAGGYGLNQYSQAQA